MRRGALLVIALSVGCLSLSGTSVDHPAGPQPLPQLMLWAWERPTDLRSLDADIGVAFLSQTLITRNGEVLIEPRRNPLRVSPHTPLVAVTRIESGEGATLPDVIAARMAEAIASTASLPRVRGVQIDFDAAESERGFYRTLVHAVRSTLGPDVPLSITALASWCAQDRWMDGLPVNEAVPMLFRLGPVNAPYASIGTAPVTAAPECRAAVGLSLDEPIYGRRHARRVYVFNPAPWTVASVARAQEALE